MDTALFESHLKFPVCEKEILTHDRKPCPLGIAQKEIIWMGGAKKNHSASGGGDPAFGFSLQRVQCSNSTSRRLTNDWLAPTKAEQPRQ